MNNNSATGKRGAILTANATGGCSLALYNSNGTQRALLFGGNAGGELNLTGGGSAVRVFWPLPAPGFMLDETTSLASPPAAVSTNATQISITVPMPVGNKYYRLRRP